MRKRTTRAGRALVARAKYAASKRSRKRPVRTAKRPVRHTGVRAAAGRRCDHSGLSSRPRRLHPGPAQAQQPERLHDPHRLRRRGGHARRCQQDEEGLEDVVQMTKGKIDVLPSRTSTGITSPASARPRTCSHVSRSARCGSPGPRTRPTNCEVAAQGSRPGRGGGRRQRAGRGDGGDPDRAQGLLDVLGLVGAAGEKTKSALDIAKAKVPNGQKPRYWRPTDRPFQVPGTDIRVFALGPPHDLALIRKILPSTSHPETYELALDGRAYFRSASSPRSISATRTCLLPIDGRSHWSGAGRSILPDPLLEPSWRERRWAAN